METSGKHVQENKLQAGTSRSILSGPRGRRWTVRTRAAVAVDARSNSLDGGRPERCGFDWSGHGGSGKSGSVVVRFYRGCIPSAERVTSNASIVTPADCVRAVHVIVHSSGLAPDRQSSPSKWRYIQGRAHMYCTPHRVSPCCNPDIFRPTIQSGKSGGTHIAIHERHCPKQDGRRRFAFLFVARLFFSFFFLFFFEVQANSNK